MRRRRQVRSEVDVAYAPPPEPMGSAGGGSTKVAKGEASDTEDLSTSGPGWTWLPAVFAALWIERRFVSWGSDVLVGSEPGPRGEAIADVGFKLLQHTPPYLPDVWAVIFTIVTLVRSNRGRSALPHIFFVLLIVWTFTARMGLITKIIDPRPECDSRFDQFLETPSLFSGIGPGSFRFSFHALYMTMHLLLWCSYQKGTSSMIRILQTIWVVALCSIISSRVDFTIDVVRGVLFGFSLWYFYVFITRENGRSVLPDKVNAVKSERPLSKNEAKAIVRSPRGSRRRAQVENGIQDLCQNPSDAALSASDDKRSAPGEAIHTSTAADAGQGVGIVGERRQTIDPIAQARSERDIARELYLDMVRRGVLNILYGDRALLSVDADLTLRHTTGYNSQLRDAGLDVPEVAHASVGSRRLEFLKTRVEFLLANGVAGDIVDLGVARGGVSVYLRAILKAHNIWDRRVILCGSFYGHRSLPFALKIILKTLSELFPISWVFSIVYWISKIIPIDSMPQAFLKDNRLREYMHLLLRRPEIFEQLSRGTSCDEVKESFDRYDLLDEQVVFLAGDLVKVLPSLPTKAISLLRVGGLAEWSGHFLSTLYPLIPIGGWIIIDDYAALLGCTQAVDRFRNERGITEPLKWIDHQCVAWRKTSSLKRSTIHSSHVESSDFLH